MTAGGDVAVPRLAFAGRRRSAWEEFVNYVKWAVQEARRFKEVEA